MMDGESQPTPTTSLGDLQLGSSGTKAPTQTDFTCCIICQRDSGKQHNVTDASLVTLKTACRARQDNVWDRLAMHLENETFIEDNNPKWHPSCRNSYLLKKSYERAERNRLEATKNTIPDDQVTPGESSRMRRSMIPAFESKKQCVICCKTYHDHKEPTSLVTTENRQSSLHRKAKELGDQALLTRIQGFGDQSIDMVAYDVRYHRACMNRYMSRRLNQCNPEDNETHEDTFNIFVNTISDPILNHSSVYLLTTLRDMYRSILRDNGMPNWESYRSSCLKKRLQSYFDDRIVFFSQAKGSDLVCSSSLPVGDVLMKLKQFQDENVDQDNQHIVLNAARILRASAKSLKASLTQSLDDLLDVSSDAAKRLVPDMIYMFTRQLLIDKKLDIGDSEVAVENAEDKALLLSQQLLYSMCNIRTPLSIGMAFDIYNESRSKTQMTKMNRLQQSISYDSFHRILTSVYNNIIAIKEEKGIYIPPNMRHGVFTHFAMDNIDWNEKTQDGSTYHATSSVMIQPHQSDDDTQEEMETDQRSINNQGNVEKPISRKRTIDQTEKDTIQSCRLTPGDKKKSRCLSEIVDLESLMTRGPKVGEQLLFLWGLGRMTPTQLLNLELDETLPGYSAFCAQVSKAYRANEIGYLPLIPSSPTDPGVVKTCMTNLVKMAETIGMTHTIITGDQAVYEIAYALRKQYPEEFGNVILMLGGFHLAHNYLKAITKIMRGSGAEDILSAAEVLLPGTANKCFGEKGDYYQTLHAITTLYEAMLSLHWEALENWSIQQNKDTSCIESLSNVIQELSSVDMDQDLSSILDGARPQLDDAKKLLVEFREATLDQPTHKLWCTFLDMMEILLSFLCAQREGHWIDYLDQAGNMLPYLVAAGHHRYGVYLSLHLNEMRNLHQTSPDVYEHFLGGEFTVRRARGRHNGVSPDMILEQTYNAEVKQKQGLCGITLTPKAQSKWLYTKPITAAVAGKLKRMLNLEPDSDTTPRHHEAGASLIQKDILAVQRCLQVVATKMVNPFKDPAAEDLICISTGVHASRETQKDLTQVKQIGEKVMKTCLDKGGDKLTVKLNTFDTTQGKKKTGNGQRKAGPEINLLQRVSQVIAAGGEVRLHELVGEYECTDIPPALFDSDGCLRHGNKSTLVKVLMEETKVNSMNDLPIPNTNTAVVIDAMHVIHKWSFRPGETFQDVANRYLQNMLRDIPPDTSSVHLCCDRYDHTPSLKAMERSRRGKTNLKKLYDIQSHLPTPAFRDFVSVEENKAALMCFLSQAWSGPHSHSPVPLFLSGGFTNETTTMMVDDHGAKEVLALSSTHEEADTRILLHALYSAEVLEADRIVIHANDTDVIVLCIYYCAKTPAVKELWVRTEPDSFLPVHQIAASLGQDKCLLLPYFHALSGKDDTSFIYGLGKKKLWRSLALIDTDPLKAFAETPDSQHVSEDLLASSKTLVIQASGGNENDTLAGLRTRKFLAGKSGLLLSLPPTEDSLEQHIKRAALATITSKSSHIPKPDSIDITSYGWLLHGNNTIQPVFKTKNSFPANLETCVKCMCKKRCAGKCACSKNNVPCYSGCYCQGKAPSCSRAIYLDPDESATE